MSRKIKKCPCGRNGNSFQSRRGSNSDIPTMPFLQFFFCAGGRFAISKTKQMKTTPAHLMLLADTAAHLERHCSVKQFELQCACVGETCKKNVSKCCIISCNFLHCFCFYFTICAFVCTMECVWNDWSTHSPGKNWLKPSWACVRINMAKHKYSIHTILSQNNMYILYICILLLIFLSILQNVGGGSARVENENLLCKMFSTRDVRRFPTHYLPAALF